MKQDTVLTSSQMKEHYGEFYLSSANFTFDSKDIPNHFHCLIPYAHFWAFPEEGDRESVFNAATKSVQLNLKTVVERLDDELDDWFAEVLNSEVRTEGYYAFAYLRMAADSYIPSIHGKPKDC